jgi:hypothetical protein
MNNNNNNYRQENKIKIIVMSTIPHLGTLEESMQM